MFERFTKDARRSVENARSVVEKRGDQKIEPAHLLLGVREQNLAVATTLDAHGLTSTVLSKVLDRDETATGLSVLGIDSKAVAQATDQAFGDGAFDRASSESASESWFQQLLRRKAPTSFTRSAKSSLERSLRIALERGDAAISEVHVALGALSTRQGSLSIYLAVANIDVVALERELGDCVENR